MQDFRRYAIYVLADGPLHDAASRWLGWDCRSGKPVDHPVIADLPAPVEDLTATPRQYGFHGTVKPPFRLADGMTLADLLHACDRLMTTLPPVQIDQLMVRPLGGFVAMVPRERSAALEQLAADVVRELDGFRALPGEAELARRRAGGLSASEEANLLRWGYPYVMDDFRFHMTLSGKRSAEEAHALAETLAAHFAPVIPQPFAIDSLGLLGEDEEGRFHLVETYALAR